MSQTVDEVTGAGGLVPSWAQRGLLRTAAMAIVGALVLVTIVFLIADAATDNLLATPLGSDAPEEIGLGVVLGTAIAGGLVGTGLAWVMSRFVPRPRMTFVVVCVVGLVFVRDRAVHRC